MRANDRLLAILGALGEHGRPVTLTELAELVGLPKSTALRFLRSLEPDGWVIRDPDGEYSLGPAVVALAGQYVSSDSVLVAASPFMRDLRDQLGETISLSRVMGTERTCVQEFPSLQSLRLVIGVGSVGPLHAGASGVLLLSSLHAETRQRVYEQGLRRFTDNTLTDPDKLERECAVIQRQGWAMSRGQKTAGGVAIAVPVPDPGAPGSLSALGIFGPEARFSPKRDKHRWLEALLQCAKQIERAVGPRIRVVDSGS